MWKNVLIGLGVLIVLIVAVALIPGDEEEPTDTTTGQTSTTLSVATQMLAESEDCDELARSVEMDRESLAAQEADPDYGMSPEDVERVTTRLEVAEDRMAELDC